MGPPWLRHSATTDAEWDACLAHFEKRKVSIGTCARASSSPCVHEHARVRCSLLRPDPAQRSRLKEIRDNLVARIAEAEREGWLGEIEALLISPVSAEDKLAQVDRRTPGGTAINLGWTSSMPKQPADPPQSISGCRPFADIAHRTTTRRLRTGTVPEIRGRHKAELPTLQPMRTVVVFPTGERAETVASLDRHLPEQRHPWTLDGTLYIDTDDEQTGCLFSDWDPEDVAILEAAIGHRPTWAVQIDVSGRIDGTAEVHQMIALLLEHGGVATDDYTPAHGPCRKSCLEQ